MANKPTNDFSNYKSINIELKGNEGDTIYIVIKDDTDPDDGSQTQVPITLTNDWKTHSIDLKEFETANLKNLFLVCGFIFFNQELEFQLKSIEYLN